jgi:hypothetical protein
LVFLQWKLVVELWKFTANPIQNSLYTLSHYVLTDLKHYQLVLFDGIAELGYVKDMIEVDVHIASVVGLGLVKPESSTFVS